MDYSFISIAVADRTCSGYQLYCGPLDPSAQETSQLNVDEKLSQTYLFTPRATTSALPTLLYAPLMSELTTAFGSATPDDGPPSALLDQRHISVKADKVTQNLGNKITG